MSTNVNIVGSPQLLHLILRAGLALRAGGAVGCGGPGVTRLSRWVVGEGMGNTGIGAMKVLLCVYEILAYV